MPRPEYMKIPYSLFPPDILAKYKLHDIIHNGCIYIQINRGMYGLKQAAILAYNQLVQYM